MVSSTVSKCIIIASVCGSVCSFSSLQAKPQHPSTSSQIHSATPYVNNDGYDHFATSSSYFNAPSSVADELRWGRNINNRFTQQRSISDSTTSQSDIMEEESRLRQTVRAAKQAFRDSREIEAYNLINDLEKGSRRMDGPTRSRLASAQSITSMDDVKERYLTPKQQYQQQNENFVMQYSEAESLDLQRSFGNLVDGSTVDYALVRAAAIAGKQAAHIIGGEDPENWID